MRFKTCFISAPFGVDTSVLRQALEEKGIRWRDQTSVKAGSSWLEVTNSELSKADFLCLVLPEGRNANIFFELGIAYARRKPVLAFLGSGVELPSDISNLTYIRSEATNLQAVRQLVSTFLEHAKPSENPRSFTKPATKIAINKFHVPATEMIGAEEYERRTAKIFEEAGFIVSAPAERRDQGADLAIWVDELQNTLGSPLLVEIKAGGFSYGRIREAASQLRSHVSKTHGRCGLIVYWDSQGKSIAEALPHWPLIIVLSGTTLTRLVAKGKLINELLRLRNAAVHGLNKPNAAHSQ
jgi:hypothetical protein